MLGRSYGLTCDRLLAARVVLADGRVIDCDTSRHDELFWALRGAGGGQFGVVTSLAFRTVPAPAVTSFDLRWPHEDATALILTWQQWAPDAPDELTAHLRVTASGDARRAPEVCVSGAMLGSEAKTVKLLGELVVGCGDEPRSASHARLPYRRLKRALAGNATPPGRVLLKSEFFRCPLPGEAIAALLRMLTHERSPNHTRELAFTPMGGAYNRIPAQATAFAHRDERFLLEHVLEVDSQTAESEEGSWASRSWACAHPWASGRVYPNFPDADLAEWARAYHGANSDRLLRIKRTYDPHNRLRFEQSLGS